MRYEVLIHGVTKKFFNLNIGAGNSKFLFSYPGKLRHSDSVNLTGVPGFDAIPFAGDFEACYVHMTDSGSNGQLVVNNGPHAKERIFGLTSFGLSVSPNSVEILFYSAPWGVDINSTNATPYIWENTQINIINIGYPYNKRIEQFDIYSFRKELYAFSPNTALSNKILDESGGLVYINDGDLVLTQ